MTDLVGKTTINGKDKYYKTYVTAQDITPWLFVDRMSLKDDVKTGSIDEFEFENSVTSLFQYQESVPKCTYGRSITNYLNRGDVRKALNIPDSLGPWLMCTHSILRHYTKGNGSQWVWEKHRNNYKLLKISGDTDLILGSYGTQKWIKSMNLPVVRPWRPYFVDDQLAGFTVKYEGLDFVTVKGAGHMVP